MYIPKIIMSGGNLHYKRHLAFKIGQYCQVHKEYTPRNSQASREKATIFLDQSGNTQCGFKFMSFHFAKNITRRVWD